VTPTENDLLDEYARGLARGAVIALDDLLEGVEARCQNEEDPTASGPTWAGLAQLLRDSRARVQERVPS